MAKLKVTVARLSLIKMFKDIILKYHSKLFFFLEMMMLSLGNMFRIFVINFHGTTLFFIRPSKIEVQDGCS